MTFGRLTQLRIFRLFRENRRMAVLMAWMAIVPIGTSLVSGYFLLGAEELIANMVTWQWLLFYACTMLTMALAITPTTYIALLSGYFIGMESLIGVVVAYQGASLLGYILARGINRGFVDQIISYYPKSAGYFDNVLDKQVMTTLLARLSPALPFALMNVVLSAAKIRLASFFWGGLIGMLPRTLFFVWVGSQAHQLRDAVHYDHGMIASIVLTIAAIYATFLMIKPKP
ncbi:TVP38/TMEM64 family protein [Reichenbachiella agariperforans]|nr:VTT domain-containing protein [Reichenbachiella agariperforans]